MNIELCINGELLTWDVEPRETLLDALRRSGLTGAKRVCESGECGACAVIINGVAVDSCIQLAMQAAGSEVITVEGLESGGLLNRVQEAFAENGAIQCGFCIPGMVVAASNYLQENPSPSEADVRHLFVGNLCRCTGYKKPIEAVLNAASQKEGAK